VFQCIVCATRTWGRVLVVHHGESIPLCGTRCCDLFLQDPLSYMGAGTALADEDRSSAGNSPLRRALKERR
jgi:hypothetical protein